MGRPIYIIDSDKNLIRGLIERYTLTIDSRQRTEMIRKVYAMTHQEARALREVLKDANVDPGFIAKDQEPPQSPRLLVGVLKRRSFRL